MTENQLEKPLRGLKNMAICINMVRILPSMAIPPNAARLYPSCFGTASFSGLGMDQFRYAGFGVEKSLHPFGKATHLSLMANNRHFHEQLLNGAPI